MIIDTRPWADLSFEERIKRRIRVSMDGVELKLVWFIDTDEGYVRTYDVLGDAHWHTMTDLMRQNIEIQSDWDDIGGVASKTLFGKITFMSYEGKQLTERDIIQ